MDIISITNLEKNIIKQRLLGSVFPNNLILRRLISILSKIRTNKYELLCFHRSLQKFEKQYSHLDMLLLIIYHYWDILYLMYMKLLCIDPLILHRHI